MDNLKKDLVSMTGFGRAQREWDGGMVTVEVRSLNHRFLEVSVRSPRDLLYLESDIKKMARDFFSRGKVETFITLEGGIKGFGVDIEKAKEVFDSLKSVADLTGDNVRLEHVLSVGDVIKWNEKTDAGSLGDLVLDVCSEAFKKMAEHRIREGTAIKEDLSGRVISMRKMADDMAPLAEEIPARIAENIREFLGKVGAGEVVDRQRLEGEIAMLSQKADVSEEFTRIAAHLNAMEEALGAGGPAGRRMDFLIQELVREVNTIGSKAGAVELSGIVVDFKSELEKVREQVQNVE